MGSFHSRPLQILDWQVIQSTTVAVVLIELQNKVVAGSLILTTTPEEVKPGDIAYISCDPSSYPGPLDVRRTIELVSYDDRLTAIILYSTHSTHCSYDDPAVQPYRITYTMTNQNASLALESSTKNGNSQGRGVIKASSDETTGNVTSSQSNGGGWSGGRSPTTAVAMIILYSITGIITALFLCIIVVGAIRAHRNPERYGPRNMLGRPRQSRARGIARAMLETIPIVKFGEKEEDKNGQQAGDAELAITQNQRDGNADADQTPAIAVQRPSTEQAARTDSHITEAGDPVVDRRSAEHPTIIVPDNEAKGEPEAVTTETIASTGKRPEGESTDLNAENGLACSVCTDDFTKGQDVRVLPCNHKFHPECIDPWLLNVSGTCPLW